MNMTAQENAALRTALALIKRNFDDATDTPRNRDLHEAIQLIVDVARNRGLLLEHGAQ